MNSLVGFETLKEQREFSRTYNKGIKKHSNSIITFYTNSSEKKVGFTASKKVGNAVVRNRAKRRLRALFAKNADRLKTGTYIFVAKNSINDIEFEIIKRDFLYTIKKLDLFNR